MQHSKSQFSKKPFLVLIFLLLSTLACYSDSPAWIFGVTDVPPSATYLPTPDAALYPARFDKAEIALAPQPTTPEEAFFFITRLPEALLPGVRNASGSCEYGSSLEILYVGHKWENVVNNVYIDDVSATTIPAEGEEASNLVLFDFENDETEWTLASDLVAGKEIQRQTSVDFAKLQTPLAEGQTLPDASNPTGVLSINSNYSGNNWLAGAYTTFAEGVDWSNYKSISARVFIANPNFTATLYIKTGAGTIETATTKQALTNNDWKVITFDLTDIADINDVREFGIRIGLDPNQTYYLVTCTGSVGWVESSRMAGPITFVRGQSAQTRNIDSNNAEIPASDNPNFMVYTDAEPPAFNLIVAQKKACRVGEIVDINDISAVKQGNIDQIWYQVRCSESDPSIFGWVEEFRLFGPLNFPRSGGLGIVSPEAGAIGLTAEAGELSDSNPAVATCEPNSTITTVDYVNLPLEDGSSQAYYQIQCGESIGWVNQSGLVEIPYPADSIVMVIGNITDPTARTGITYNPAPLTSDPSPAFEGNIVGECPSGSVLRLGQAASDLGQVFYEVSCGPENITGWIEARYLPSRVSFELNIPAWFVAPSVTGRGASELGFSILERPSIASPKVGQCALFKQGSIINNTFEKKASAGAGRSPYRVYYEMTCISLDGSEITGWVEQDTIINAVTTQNPNRFIG